MCSFQTLKNILLIIISTVSIIAYYANFSGEHQTISCFYLKFTCPTYKIQGFTEKGYERAKDAFEKLFQDHWEHQAQFSVYHKGKLVINLFGSVNNEPIEENSMTTLYSSGKVIESLSILLLHQRGLLKLDDNISKHWPEFAKNGKENITIQDVLKHESGIGVQPKIITLDLLQNRSALAEMIEDMTPLNYGEFFYHGYNRGIIINEVIQRVDPKKRTTTKFVHEEFTIPLNIDYYIGNVPLEKHSKVLILKEPIVYRLIPNLLIKFLLPESQGGFKKSQMESFKDISNPETPAAKMFFGRDFGTNNTEIWTKGECSSVLTVSNAKSLAKIASLVGNGESDGFRMFSEEIINLGHSEMTEKVDQFTRLSFNFTKAGFCLFNNTYGWDGTGGSAFRWNRKYQLGLGFVPTALQISLDNRYNILENVVIDIVKDMN